MIRRPYTVHIYIYTQVYICISQEVQEVLFSHHISINKTSENKCKVPFGSFADQHQNKCFCDTNWLYGYNLLEKAFYAILIEVRSMWVILVIFKETKLTASFWTKSGTLPLLWYFLWVTVYFGSQVQSKTIFFPRAFTDFSSWGNPSCSCRFSEIVTIPVSNALEQLSSVIVLWGNYSDLIFLKPGDSDLGLKKFRATAFFFYFSEMKLGWE